MVKEILNIKKGWNLISFSLYNLNFDEITNDKRILEIKNFKESYNSSVPKIFNDLTKVKNTSGYFLYASDDFLMEVTGDFLDYKNIDDGNKEIIISKLRNESNKINQDKIIKEQNYEKIRLEKMNSKIKEISNSDILDVIIIGAGIAGMTAANKLLAKNLKIKILEGSDEIGGRARNVSLFNNTFNYDIGAQFIHGLNKNNPIVKLYLQSTYTPNINNIDWENDKNMILNYIGDLSGGYMKLDEIKKYYALIKDVQRETKKRRKYNCDPNINYQTELDKTINNLDPSILKSIDIDILKVFIDAETVDTYGAENDNLSYCFFDLDGLNSLMGETDGIPSTGYSNIIKELSKNIIDYISVKKIVKSVLKDSNNLITVTCSDNSFYICKNIICTVPLSILKDSIFGQGITFNPKLPNDFSNSINNLQMNFYEKVVIKFKKQFWKNVDTFYIRVPNIPFTTWINISQSYNLEDQYILATYMPGKRFSSIIKNNTDEYIVNIAVNSLKLAFGEKVSDIIDYKVTSWHNNPLFKGSYSYVGIGTEEKDYDILTDGYWNNQLFFAGEHTSKYYIGTTHGAYNSGELAAKKLLDNYYYYLPEQVTEIKKIKIIDYFLRTHLVENFGATIIDNVYIYVDINSVSSLVLDYSEFNDVYGQNCINEDSQFYNLDGLENFYYLKYLDCNCNPDIKVLNVENNIKLKKINCSKTNIIKLNVKNNIKLEDLNCYSTKIEELDLISNIQLKNLDCGYTNISHLDLSNNKLLEHLSFCYLKLQEINIKYNTELKTISCNGAYIYYLDLSNNIKLEKLYCEKSLLLDLDLKKNINLKELDIIDTDIVKIDLTNNKQLKKLYCGNTNIITLNLNENKQLVTLSCFDTYLTELNVSSLVYLKELYCSDLNISEIDVTNNKILEVLYCNNTKILRLDLTNNKMLKILYCNNTYISKLDLTNNTELIELKCDNTNILELDLRNNKKLKKIIHNSYEKIKKIFIDPHFADINNWEINNPNFYYIDRIGIESRFKWTEIIINGECLRKPIFPYFLPKYNEENDKYMYPFDKNTYNNGKIESYNGKIESYLKDKNKYEFMLKDIKRISIDNENFGKLEYSPIIPYFFQNLTSLKMNNVIFNKLMMKFDLTNNKKLKILHITEVSGFKGLLDVTKNINLEELICAGTRIGELDVTKNINLKELNCNGTHIRELDVTKNINLENLYCNDTRISELDVTKNINLKELNCSDSNILELDVTKNINLKELNCSDSNILELDVTKNINLEKLICNNTNISELDVTKNINLKELNCSDSIILELDVTKNINLEKLICNNTSIRELDVTKNINLKILNCTNINISKLDVTKNINLEKLNCSDSSIRELDITKNINLTYLDCSGTNIYELNLRENHRLEYMRMDSDKLRYVYINDVNQGFDTIKRIKKINYVVKDTKNLVKIDLTEPLIIDHYKEVGILYVTDDNKDTFFVEQNTLNSIISSVLKHYKFTTFSSVIDFTFFQMLKNLINLDLRFINKNSIILNLDLNTFVNLTYLYCSDINIRELDVTKNINLRKLYCNNTNISELDVTKNINLTYLDCSGTNISELDVTKNINLRELNVEKSIFLIELDVTKNINLISLKCSGTNISELDVTKNINLTYLYCSDTNIRELDVTKNINLTYLYCSDTNIRELDVTKNINLESLKCSYTEISELDVTNNINLEELYCNNTNISKLDVTKNINLEKLNCSDSSIRELDITKNINLTYLDCSGTNISKLDVTNNINLEELYCNNTNISKLDVTNNINLEKLNCSDSNIIELDVTKNINLTNLSCSNTNIELIDLTYNHILESFVYNDDNWDFEEVLVFRNSLTLSDSRISNPSPYWNWSDSSGINYKEKYFIKDDLFGEYLINEHSAFKLTNNFVGFGFRDISNIEHIKIKNLKYRNIKNINEIEMFTKLRTIELDNINISSLDLTNNKELYSLRCENCVNLKKIILNSNYKLGAKGFVSINCPILKYIYTSKIHNTAGWEKDDSATFISIESKNTDNIS